MLVNRQTCQNQHHNTATRNTTSMMSTDTRNAAIARNASAATMNGARRTRRMVAPLANANATPFAKLFARNQKPLSLTGVTRRSTRANGNLTIMPSLLPSTARSVRKITRIAPVRSTKHFIQTKCHHM